MSDATVEAFALFGTWIAMWMALSILYIIAEAAMSRLEEISPAPFLINIFLAYLIASFILKPESYGYSKIVSENEIEEMVEASGND